MTKTHFIAHTPVGPTGRLEWDSWQAMVAAITAAHWTGTVDRFVENVPGLRPVRFIDGLFAGYGERH